MTFSNLSSYIFNLVTFGFFVLFIAKQVFNTPKAAGKFYGKRKFYNLFLVVGILAILTQWSYIDAPQRIFSNAEHHVIEHLGFSFENSLDLVNEQTPNKAIWDEKKGKLTLHEEPNGQGFRLTGSNFYEPLYLKKDNIYLLANLNVKQPIKNQLKIKLDTVEVELTISNSTSEYPYSFITRTQSKKYGPFQIPFRFSLETGFTLGALLSKAKATAPNMGLLEQALDSVLLVRQKVSTNGKMDLVNNPLLLFPSNSFIANHTQLTIDNTPISLEQNSFIDVAIASNQYFYFGIQTTRTKIYKAICKDSKTGLCEWLVNFPDKKYLKKLESENETLFFTSSADEVSKSEQLAGFYYPILERPDNDHHFSANLGYKNGSTKDKMSFRVVNLDQNDLLNENNAHLYQAGDTIRVESRGVSQGLSNTRWLFRIKDLKATNPLQFWHLWAFTVWIILCVFISIYLTKVDKPNQIDKQSKAEYLVYLMIITLLTIRSILLWRMSTFLPTEEISAKVYGSLANGGWLYFRNGVVVTTIFFVAIWSWKIWGDEWSEKLSQRFDKLPNIFSFKDLGVFCLYIIPVLFKIGASFISELERIAAVYLPVLVYVVIELWFLYRLHRAKKISVQDIDYQRLAKINWLICFGYLAVSDAGFSIVFLLSTLIFWLIRCLTFPDYQRKNQQNNLFISRFGHWEFLLPIVAIILFLFFTPHVLSMVFQKTNWLIFGVIALLSMAVVFTFLNKKLIIFLQRQFPKSVVVIGLLVVVALVLVGKEKINEKFQDKGYVRYRAEVLIKTPDEVIKDEAFKFNLGNDSKLLRAAQNQWIINYFYEKGKEGSFLWGMIPNPINYFRVLPSFQKGSPYMTQISDLVTVRYLIGEHSQWILVQLLILMILLIGASLDGDTRFNVFSKIRVFLTCLLFAVGFFIWLAATNRMVFLGQDFPLLSMNSWLSLIFTFTVFFGVIVLGNQANEQEGKVRFNAYGNNFANKLLRGLVPVVIFGVALFRQHDFSERRFDLGQTIANLQEDFVGLNNEFANFQADETRKELSLGDLVQQFDASLGDSKKTLFKSDFARSAYEAYLGVLSKQNNSENLIHIRRGTDGVYDFAVNKLFYSVQSPDVFTDTWRGHLVAQEDNSTFGFLNRQTNHSQEIEPTQRNGDLEHSFGTLINQSQNNNIRLTQLPAGWALDSLPVVIISQTKGEQKGNRSTFLVKNGQEVFKSRQSDFAFALKANDIIQFMPVGSAKPVTLQYQHQSMTYLAKNVWLNGRYQFFYPLQHKFLWSYYFANLVKSKFEQNTNDRKRNLVVTIDPMLTARIYDQAEHYFHENKWDAQTENARAFNLVVLGSDGGIRALCDFKKGAKIKIDPNRMNNYQDLFESQYLNADTDQERLLFGNRCLLRSDNGPASTFKPLMYAAVTSQFNFNWHALRFGGLGTTPFERSNNEGIVIRHFGNRPIKFTVDNNLNIAEHGNDEYISHSTNTYNSMIVFLGSLEKTEISQVQQYVNGNRSLNTFLRAGLSDTLEYNFPNFKYDNQSYRVNLFPKDWANNNSLMAHGLWENFKIPTTPEQLSGREGENLQNIAFDLDSVGFANSQSSNKLWSFPEPSHLYLIDRNSNNNAIVQLATGADPINTTPLKMAEMAAKLYSFNRSFRSTVLGNVRSKYQAIKTDDTWGSDAQLTSFYGSNLINAMHNALQPGGTANGLLGGLMNQYANYHFYAKTGTISGNRFGGKRDKHLMLIISKNPLNVASLTPEDMKNNRFFVLYFSFYKQSISSEWGDVSETVRNMTETVINSKSFKNLMK